ncbi:carboxypeptidase regulatory-like domain-containing protein [bacterium]|nr:carboxypeptidase regulatory-like domain-containing protein [candidate division CSSED10-310 bacterium]
MQRSKIKTTVGFFGGLCPTVRLAAALWMLIGPSLPIQAGPDDEYSISGTVWINRDIEPLPYPELELNGSGWTKSGNSRGEYVFDGLAPGGPYRIRIHSDPEPGMRWAFETVDVYISWDDVDNVDFYMVEDAPTPTPTAEPDRYAISGAAWKIPDTLGYEYPELRLDPVGRTVTGDETGHYRFDDLENGTYHVKILSEPIQGFQWERSQISVEIDGADVSGVDFYLIPGPPPPSPDPGEEQYLSVEIALPSDWFRHEDPFWIEGRLHNDTDTGFGQLHAVFLLEVLGTCYFWPDWNPPDYRSTPPFPAVGVLLWPGITIIDVIEDAVWPYTGESSLTGIRVYGGLLDAGLTRLVGTPGCAEFGFGS